MMHSEHHEIRRRGDQSWQRRAACATAVDVARDPDLFFPATVADEPRIVLAKRICSSCEVRNTCLEAALECGDTDGIRGGMTEAERRAVRHQFDRRCDPTRVVAALSGRDVHLSGAEREDLIRRAVLMEAPAARVAQVLNVSEAHVKKLFRRERRRRVGISLEAPEGTQVTREAIPA
ncbi:WhiB family transcriptional regulator [Streptomyces sp. TRM S81-3]|uniref:Transcriptional regulator WhiB n=1 Tax=Streptomyces griseicoloratus TaxID=2752516 RepID=A0A926L9W2_9ACTN|nr:WhiB family transcriptional regulator [Streptomyces griseicoloratus]MBD0422733.1 WhiB family transcriptional regulator [Streptomyces griseicoloratus]